MSVNRNTHYPAASTLGPRKRTESESHHRPDFLGRCHPSELNRMATRPWVLAGLPLHVWRKPQPAQLRQVASHWARPYYDARCPLRRAHATVQEQESMAQSLAIGHEKTRPAQVPARSGRRWDADFPCRLSNAKSRKCHQRFGRSK